MQMPVMASELFQGVAAPFKGLAVVSFKGARAVRSVWMDTVHKYAHEKCGAARPAAVSSHGPTDAPRLAQLSKHERFHRQEPGRRLRLDDVPVPLLLSGAPLPLPGEPAAGRPIDPPAQRHPVHRRLVLRLCGHDGRLLDAVRRVQAGPIRRVCALGADAHRRRHNHVHPPGA